MNEIIDKNNIILLPTYNEKENVRILIPEIFNILPHTFILVIDDNSPDGTTNEVKKMMKKYPKLNLLKRNEKTGLGEAYKDGIKKILTDKYYSNINTIITMDADGSHPTKYLPNMLDNLKKFDLVIGSRYYKKGKIENWEFWREKLSRWGNIYSRILTGLKIKDLTAGFIAIKKNKIKKINFNSINSTGYAYQIEFKYYCHKIGAKITEIPITFKSRREGESKISNQIIIEGLKTPLKLFFRNIWIIK